MYIYVERVIHIQYMIIRENGTGKYITSRYILYYVMSRFKIMKKISMNVGGDKNTCTYIHMLS